MTARTQRVARHALAAFEKEGALWAATCSCGKAWKSPVRDDAGRLFESHQDSFDDWREEQSPMIPGHEQPCSACGALLWVIGDRDALCRSCDLWDHSWNHL